jgi:prevent-host-death family protein
MDWPLAEAKDRLGELFQRTLDEGSQRIVRQGGDAAVVVIPEAQYELMRRRKPTFVEHLLSAPKCDFDLYELIRRDEPSADGAACSSSTP